MSEKGVYTKRDLGVITCECRRGVCTVCNEKWESGKKCPNGHGERTDYHVVETGVPGRGKRAVRCEALANHCNICGAFFSEGDDICANQHMIGQYY